MALTETEKKRLLELARETIEARLGGGPAPDPEDITPALAEHRGAFVTLHNGEALRGCIGSFTSDKPLYENIIEMALSAAERDPRFPPVTAEEMPGITIEISVLSPLEETTDPHGVEVGRHGIFIVRGEHAGVLLPQVAADWGFDRYQFLDATCEKAGLPPGCWKEEGTRILLFEAEVFGEEE
jgi:AmmeMemoRadiSam system protein A